MTSIIGYLSSIKLFFSNFDKKSFLLELDHVP